MSSSKHNLNRREFMDTLGRTGAGACVACGVGGIALPVVCAAPPRPTREVDFYESLPGKRIQCFVCPLHCKLEEGETCFCRTRTNYDGKLFTEAYNNPCVLRVDPIEKTPLNHYRPGSKCVTVGVGGCNLRCIYCQNWSMSQELPKRAARFDLSPRQAVDAAVKRNIDTIAFNFTEPVAFLEYATDIARLAKKRDLHVICATAAFIDPKPLIAFARYVDAFAVTLKGFTETFYHDSLGISLAPVLAAIKTIRHETDSWLEVIHLTVPGYNDNMNEIRRMCGWIRGNVGAATPLHFARFVPDYKLKDIKQTSVKVMEEARRVALKGGMKYVYLSNVAPHPATNTYCPRCRKPIIERHGFEILRRADDAQGRCPACRIALPGVWT